jgi:hypothetical protein
VLCHAGRIDKTNDYHYLYCISMLAFRLSSYVRSTVSREHVVIIRLLKRSEKRAEWTRCGMTFFLARRNSTTIGTRLIHTVRPKMCSPHTFTVSEEDTSSLVHTISDKLRAPLLRLSECPKLHLLSQHSTFVWQTSRKIIKLRGRFGICKGDVRVGATIGVVHIFDTILATMVQ